MKLMHCLQHTFNASKYVPYNRNISRAEIFDYQISLSIKFSLFSCVNFRGYDVDISVTMLTIILPHILIAM